LPTDADVLRTNFLAGQLKRLRMTCAELQDINPRIVVAHLTG